MKAVIQRVKEASVSVEGKSAQGRSLPAGRRGASGGKIAEIGPGLLVLLGVAEGDTEEQVQKLAKKIAALRIMADEQLPTAPIENRGCPIRGIGKGRESSAKAGRRMNLSVRDVDGEVLVISQFTLLADTSRGHRPSFIKAAGPKRAEELYNLFVEELKKLDIPVKTGKFGEYMQVSLVNDGPVTIILDS